MCLFVIIGLILPRITIFLLWFLTNWFGRIFSGVEVWLWPLLGLLFIPYTLLWYSAVQNWFNGQWGLLQIIVLIIAIITDISATRGVGGHKK